MSMALSDRRYNAPDTDCRSGDPHCANSAASAGSYEAYTGSLCGACSDALIDALIDDDPLADLVPDPTPEVLTVCADCGNESYDARHGCCSACEQAWDALVSEGWGDEDE